MKQNWKLPIFLTLFSLILLSWWGRHGFSKIYYGILIDHYAKHEEFGKILEVQKTLIGKNDEHYEKVFIEHMQNRDKRFLTAYFGPQKNCRRYEQLAEGRSKWVRQEYPESTQYCPNRGWYLLLNDRQEVINIVSFRNFL